MKAISITLIRNMLLVATIWGSHSQCLAGEDSSLFGRYAYEEYSFIWPTGQSTGFKELGASGAVLEINSDMSITLTMHMLDGTDHVSRAQVLELHLDSNTGYLIAKWPEMDYPVRKDFKTHGDIFNYVIHFTNPADHFRYGGKDQGTLKRLPDNTAG